MCCTSFFNWREQVAIAEAGKQNMCGIVGLLSSKKIEESRAAVQSMLRASRHRGPDSEGVVEIPLEPDTVILGQTRLSILDLSNGSTQPMYDEATGSYLVFNGEIYNYRQLRKDLELLGAKFRTIGDTEVLLKALVFWGERALQKLEGMFAFAFWDGLSERLWLARDPVGMKPLYFYEGPRDFAFASEVKILNRARTLSFTLDSEAIESFLTFGAVIGDRTVYREVREIEPGHMLQVNLQRVVTDIEYWSLTKYLLGNASHSMQDGDCAVGQIGEQIESAVQSHLVSDVPVGIPLSGGIDSSLLAVLATKHSNAPVTLLTVAFPEEQFSELPYARQIARTLKQRHEVVQFDSAQLIALLPEALSAMDQPTVDGINTFVVSRAAASLGLKVLLTGIGGDEIFGGYTTFLKVPLLRRHGQVLKTLARVFGRLKTRRAIQWEKIASARPPLTTTAAYLLQRSIRWQSAGSNNPEAWHLECVESLNSDFQKLAVLEMSFYLRNQLLKDADVFSMANSVELRSPFLDLRLIQAALRIPSKYHFAGGSGKKVSRDLLAKLLNSPLQHRPKMGFTFPWQQWLCSTLKKVVSDTLLNKNLYEPLMLNPSHGKHLLDDMNRRHPLRSWSEVWSLFVLLRWQSRTGAEHAAA